MWAAIGVEIAGIDHAPFDLAVYAVGWTLGWLLLWNPRPLPSDGAHADRNPVAVVIPARNEADVISHLLRPLEQQRRDGDEIVVVDDHSTDDTRRVATLPEVEVASAPEPAPGWLGKPNACWHGASLTAAEVLIFLDADVQPGPTLLDDLAAEVMRHPTDVVSVQPWHRMENASEQPSIICNVTALMGCGAFSVLGPRATATVAFGPVIAVSRSTYLRVGGHGAPSVRAMHTEDIGLARSVGRSRLYVGSPGSTMFRMYPSGLRELVRGWTRSIATGARFVPWWLAVATAMWIWSLAGGWIATPVVYPLSAIQVWAIGRRAGTIHPVAAAAFPILVLVFVVIFVRSVATVAFRRQVTWKGRRVETRPG